MKAIGLTISLLFIFSIIGCNFDGKKQFGNLSLYYDKSSITSSEAEALGKPGDAYEIKVTVKRGAESNPDFKNLAASISRNVFDNERVELHLYDEYTDIEKVVYMDQDNDQSDNKVTANRSNTTDPSDAQESQQQPGTVDTNTTTTDNGDTKWSYATEKNKMTSGDIKYASIDANELLYFSWSHKGGATATFTVRKKEGENDIYLQVSKGMFNSNGSYANMLRIRFDDGQSFRVSYSRPSDNSSNTIFLGSVPTILNKLKKAKKMRIEVEFYMDGTRVIEFDVAGFTWGN